jgi:hypothetical protein
LEVAMLLLLFVMAGALLLAAFVVAGYAGAAAAAADGAFAADVPAPPATSEPLRSEGATPAVFRCGCSHLKVAAGLCDLYGPTGARRPADGEGAAEPWDEEADTTELGDSDQGGGAVNGWGKGLDGLTEALEDAIGVRAVGGAFSAWVVRGDGAGVRAGMDREKLEHAEADAQAVLDTLALAVLPAAQMLFAERCGCTDSDPARCCEAALERLGLALDLGRRCPCACHSGEGGGA